MDLPEISVNGANNRVAGRDYLEVNAIFRCAPELLHMLDLKPCPECEERFVNKGTESCKHCIRQKKNNSLMAWCAITYIPLYLPLAWYMHHLPTDGGTLQILAKSGIEAGVTLGALAAVMTLLRNWWMNRDLKIGVQG